MSNRPGRGQRVNALPKPATLAAKVRASIEAQLAEVARDRDQARTNIEHGQRMVGEANAALIACNAVEIALKKQLEDLAAAEKTDAPPAP